MEKPTSAFHHSDSFGMSATGTGATAVANDGFSVHFVAKSQNPRGRTPYRSAPRQTERNWLECPVQHCGRAECAKDLGKPFVQLTGEDGNVFSIIGRVSGALRKAKLPDKAKEFTDKAFGAGSYNEVLRLAMTYCDVS